MIDNKCCRGCGKPLIVTENPKGNAYDPKTKEPAKWNHYGGWVCSKQCDISASLELERSMPGHGGNQTKIGQFAQETVNRNWNN